MPADLFGIIFEIKEPSFYQHWKIVGYTDYIRICMRLSVFNILDTPQKGPLTCCKTVGAAGKGCKTWIFCLIIRIKSQGKLYGIVAGSIKNMIEIKPGSIHAACQIIHLCTFPQATLRLPVFPQVLLQEVFPSLSACPIAWSYILINFFGFSVK